MIAFQKELGLGVVLLVASAMAAAADEDPAFGHDWLVAHARSLADQAYVDPAIEPGNPLAQLSYNQYRAIRFKREASIWRGESRNFSVELLHLGFMFTTPVAIHLVGDNGVFEIPYRSDLFDYGLDTERIKDGKVQGYSGFRIAAPINSATYYDEFLVFQGASYFRAVGRDQHYGLSARGLAVNTARPEGEEFPSFRAFYIERPEVDAQRIMVYALLDSPSITGAYRFRIEPGSETVIDVDCILFPRIGVTTYGIAPLTSMYLFDAVERRRFDDFRNAVHDSSGLKIVLGNGEHVWRPLANPVALQVSSFATPAPRGFGLMQRNRQFEQFEDIEARYERRPSLWIEPAGDWGQGHVELVEIPTGEEIHDNIVAYWRPDLPMAPGNSYAYSYRMRWGEGPAEARPPGRVVGTRAGGAADGDVRIFAVDYAAESIPPDVTPKVTTSAGTIVETYAAVVEATGNYRIFFKFDPAGTRLAELRLTLESNGNRWGETWLYRWTR